MNSAYIALGYACNQKCSFCPCSQDDRKLHSLTIEQIHHIIDDMVQKGICSIVISGGEPTIHATFFETVAYALENHLQINILTNSEKFSVPEFMQHFSEVIFSHENNITVTTTIHSQNADEHESINASAGSFLRSIQGLKELNQLGVHVIVKHCITRRNYKDLRNFYEFIDECFSKDVSIQFCSIDFCGINEEELDKHRIVYPSLKPYFEEMFDCYLQKETNGENRNMYCINMPLCAADPYYWRFFAEKSGAYRGYASPQTTENDILHYQTESDVGTFSDTCKKCRAESICPGTYKTAFALFGNSIFKEYD